MHTVSSRSDRARSLLSALLALSLLPLSATYATPSRSPEASGIAGVVMVAGAAARLARPASVERAYPASGSASLGVGVIPFAYATTASTSAFSVRVADGRNEKEVARVAVDAVQPGDARARLSRDGTRTAFTVRGFRSGMSALYVADVLKSGKYAAIATAPDSTAGFGAFAWSPAGNTMAYVYSSPSPEVGTEDDAFGTVYIYSAGPGFKPVALASSSGSDRLLGFSSNGLGVFVMRESGGMQNLMYLPLPGGPGGSRALAGQTLLRSSPGIRYSDCALWARGWSRTRLACLVGGSYSLTPADAPGPAPMLGDSPLHDRVQTSGQMSGDGGLGILAVVPAREGDAAAGLFTALIRRDAEQYNTFAWTPDGAALIAGGGAGGQSWRVDMNGGRRPLVTDVSGLDIASATPDGKVIILADRPGPATRLVTFNLTTLGVHGVRYVGALSPAPSPRVDVQLAVPYVHQVKDVGGGEGDWACGPASVDMVLAYYGRLARWSTYQATHKAEGSGAVAGQAQASYLVQTGDSLSVIGAHYGVSVDDLVRANGLPDTTIYAGQTLAIPGSASAPSPRPAAPALYAVQDGDSLWAIAGNFGVEVEALASANGLDPDATIYPAQQLVIPGAGSPNSTAGAPASGLAKVPSGVDYAAYITNAYSAYGRDYSSTSPGPDGQPVPGLYGAIMSGGFASWGQMVSVLTAHGLSTRYLDVTREAVTTALQRGHPVILANGLTPAGHILVVIGFSSDGSLIVNDPFGNAFAPGYGSNDGRGVRYPWSGVGPTMALEVMGPGGQ